MSEQTFKLKPANAGITVRDPETRRPLAAKGEIKPRTPYWMRRIADGDVLDVTKKNKDGGAL